MKLFLAIIIVVFSFSQKVFATDESSIKKLKFKESGPFYGIKENGRMVRGILKGFQNKGFKTDFYGLFTKNQLYWKGYSEIKYDDGRVLYQYNEYKLDENGKVIIDKDGIYQLVDSYLISEEDFEKVRKYITYDIAIPFKLYNFEDTKTKIAKKNIKEPEEITEIKSAKIQNNNDKSYKDIKRDLEVEGEPFILNLGDLKTGEKNVSVTIKKRKIKMSGWLGGETIAWDTTFNYTSKKIETIDGKIIGGIARNYEITEYENFPTFKRERAWRTLGQVTKYTNIPKESKMYKRTKSNSVTTNLIAYTSREYIEYGEDSGYLNWHNLALPGDSIKKRTIVEAIGTKQGEMKKIIGGLCKDPNEFFKLMYKEYVNNCNIAYLDAINEHNKLLNDNFDNNLHQNLQKKFLTSLNNQKKIINTNEKYYALVIGNNNYEYLEKLDAAENDAEVIADVLTNKYGFEVDLLLNADYDTTVNSLFKITNKLKRNDNLLIYYAGHGELDKAENRGYWLPVDASYELRSKWISNQRIVDRIKATKAKHVLLIADSCFSGTLMRSGTAPDVNEAVDEKYIKRLKSKKTRLVITSGGNEPVVDSDGGDHSLFALKLIDTLKNNNTVINSQMLFENIRRYVVSNADQTPERAMVHKTGHDGGDFLFFPKN
ncbi:caspase family protein [Candidatus Pelagibacter sp.]|nr:caspase family protein [Candidatus Pelagibacter sp.]